MDSCTNSLMSRQSHVSPPHPQVPTGDVMSRDGLDVWRCTRVQRSAVSSDMGLMVMAVVLLSLFASSV